MLVFSDWWMWWAWKRLKVKKFIFVSLPPIIFWKNWLVMAQFDQPWLGDGFWEFCSFIFSLVSWRICMLMIRRGYPNIQIYLYVFNPPKVEFIHLLWVFGRNWTPLMQFYSPCLGDEFQMKVVLEFSSIRCFGFHNQRRRQNPYYQISFVLPSFYYFGYKSKFWIFWLKLYLTPNWKIAENFISSESKKVYGFFSFTLITPK